MSYPCSQYLAHHTHSYERVDLGNIRLIEMGNFDISQDMQSLKLFKGMGDQIRQTCGIRIHVREDANAVRTLIGRDCI